MKYTKSREIWAGSHLGVSFEINHFVTEPNVVEPFERHHWTYYIFLHIDRISEQYNPQSFWLKGTKKGSHVFYDYYNHPIINRLNFHYGITWYSKEHGFDGSPKIIKIGCDYQHYWDEGHDYDVNSLAYDVKNTIEDFKNKIPDYKYWCIGNGKLYDINEGIIKDEQFCSEEYFGKKEWFIELKNKMVNV